MKKYLINDSLENFGELIMTDSTVYDSEQMANEDIKSHISQLEELYEQIEDKVDPQLQYALGDMINLLSNIEFKDINKVYEDVVDYFIKEACTLSSNGSWIIYQEEIEDYLGQKIDETFIKDLANEFNKHEEVAEVYQVSQDDEQFFIDIQLWDDYVFENEEENEL